MKLKTFLIVLTASIALSMLHGAAISAQEPLKPSQDLSDPFVAYAGPAYGQGQEVEIRFHLDKIKAMDLTLKDLEKVKYMRFLGEGYWKRKFGDVTVDVRTIAECKFRRLQAPPFTVKLLDGREAIITPDIKMVAFCQVPGWYFQEDVIRSLAMPYVEEPAKAIVMDKVGLDSDTINGPDRRDVKEKSGRVTPRRLPGVLIQFANVELRGTMGPQIAELSRMRSACNMTAETIGRTHGLSRELFEKSFGPGKPSDAKAPDGPTEYILRAGRLKVYWKGGKVVSHFEALHGKELPKATAAEPEKLAAEAREFADARRAFVLELLSKIRDTLPPAQRWWMPGLLDQSQAQLQWTEAERLLMLGSEPGPQGLKPASATGSIVSLILAAAAVLLIIIGTVRFSSSI